MGKKIDQLHLYLALSDTDHDIQRRIDARRCRTQREVATLVFIKSIVEQLLYCALDAHIEALVDQACA